MEPSPDIADHFVLCILLGAFFGTILLAATFAGIFHNYRQRLRSRIEERKNRNLQKSKQL